MTLMFEAEVIYWHGPAPFVFGVMPIDISHHLKAVSSELSYGWGCIPVKAKIKNSEWRTSLFPKNNRYLVPIKLAIQKAENVIIGETIPIELEVG